MENSRQDSSSQRGRNPRKNSSSQRGRNSRKDSADSPFSMLNSVNTEIFITLNNQRRLNNKSFRAALRRAMRDDLIRNSAPCAAPSFSILNYPFSI